MRDKILFKRGYLESSSFQQDKKKTAYLIAKLINQFGVIVDKPELLTEKNVKDISKFLGVDIPEGFYANPQDIVYFSCEELIIEQFVSYIQIQLNGEFCLDKKVFERNNVFKKVLPTYMEGDDVKLRKFKLLNKDQAEDVLDMVASDLCLYTRPWAVDELAEFNWLYLNGYYYDEELLCKDNAINMFLKCQDVVFASMLDKKDIVKMSLYKFGETKVLDFSDEDITLFKLALSVAKDCPMSKKQAKYYNRILKNIDSELPIENNNKSVYKKAINLIKHGKIVDAAKVFAASGSLLERNLVYLLSRASFGEIGEILDLLKSSNPITLIQMVLGIVNNSNQSKRVFKFTYANKVKVHVETDYEFKYRKSILSSEMKKILIEKLNEQIKAFYQNKKSLGKIFISPVFKNVALPINTSAMGMGNDVMPTGSRLPIKFDYLRTFCYWYKVFDIDASVVFIHEDGSLKTFYWGNMSKKEFGNSCLCSGDNRNKDGSEFCDFKISELKNQGYKYAVYNLNGFGGTLNQGEIYCGLQNKSNLKTQVFDSKNIEFKIHVKGDSRGFIGFAIDFEKNEIVVLNQMLANGSNVVNPATMITIKQYLDTIFLDNFNMYKILSYMGEIVENKNDADVVFNEDRIDCPEDKIVITPFDIEKMVHLLK